MHLPINHVRFPGGQMERLRLVSTWNAFHAWASLRKSLCDGPGVYGGKAKRGTVSGGKGRRMRGGEGTRAVGETVELKTD